MTGRVVTLVCYDIGDSKRLREVFQLCKGYGEHMQYSVFCMTWSRSKRTRFVGEIDAAIHHTEDRVMLVDLGPEGPGTLQRFESLGIRWSPTAPGPVIV